MLATLTVGCCGYGDCKGSGGSDCNPGKCTAGASCQDRCAGMPPPAPKAGYTSLERCKCHWAAGGASGGGAGAAAATRGVCARRGDAGGVFGMSAMDIA